MKVNAKDESTADDRVMESANEKLESFIAGTGDLMGFVLIGFDDARSTIVSDVAQLFNQKGLEFEESRVPQASKSLSPREVDALTFLAMGYSRAQVADTLSISEHTLRAYIESARFKLNALNTTHAVARALSRGLIVV